jgi:hypothetical protein
MRGCYLSEPATIQAFFSCNKEAKSLGYLWWSFETSPGFKTFVLAAFSSELGLSVFFSMEPKDLLTAATYHYFLTVTVIYFISKRFELNFKFEISEWMYDNP